MTLTSSHEDPADNSASLEKLFDALRRTGQARSSGGGRACSIRTALYSWRICGATIARGRTRITTSSSARLFRKRPKGFLISRVISTGQQSELSGTTGWANARSLLNRFRHFFSATHSSATSFKWSFPWARQRASRARFWSA